MSSSLGTRRTTLRQVAKAVDLVDRYKTPIATLGWLAFAAICADYADFIDLPTLLAVPAWIAATLNILRWALWEGLLKARVVRAIEATRRVSP